MTAATARVLPFIRPVDVDVVEDLALVPAVEETSPATPVTPATPVADRSGLPLDVSTVVVLPVRLAPVAAVVAAPPAAALLAWAATGSPVAMVATGCTAMAAVVTVEVAGRPRVAQAVAALPWVGRWSR